MGEIRRFVQIDDYKRALYMQARGSLLREFNTYGSAFICIELRSVLAKEIRADETAYYEFVCDIIDDFDGMFPELIELFDGYAYTSSGEWLPVGVKCAWFEAEMIEARIALIDFILTQ